jgi:hypothetical protein
VNLLRFGDVGWVFTDTDLKIESEDHEKALNLALNKISGEWDFEKLGDILEDLEINDFDVDLTGFDDFEIEEIKFNNDIEFDSDMDLSDDDLSEDKEDEKQIITCPYCHEEFEV